MCSRILWNFVLTISKEIKKKKKTHKFFVAMKMKDTHAQIEQHSTFIHIHVCDLCVLCLHLGLTSKAHIWVMWDERIRLCGYAAKWKYKRFASKYLPTVNRVANCVIKRLKCVSGKSTCVLCQSLFLLFFFIFRGQSWIKLNLRKHLHHSTFETQMYTHWVLQSFPSNEINKTNELPMMMISGIRQKAILLEMKHIR